MTASCCTCEGGRDCSWLGCFQQLGIFRCSAACHRLLAGSHGCLQAHLPRRPDGGCVALDTEDLPPNQQLPEDAPVLILLPGLTGGSEDSYVQHAVVRPPLLLLFVATRCKLV